MSLIDQIAGERVHIDDVVLYWGGKFSKEEYLSSVKTVFRAEADVVDTLSLKVHICVTEYPVEKETNCTYLIDFGDTTKRFYKHSNSAFAKATIEEAVISLQKRMLRRQSILSSRLKDTNAIIDVLVYQTKEKRAELIERIKNSSREVWRPY